MIVPRRLRPPRRPLRRREHPALRRVRRGAALAVLAALLPLFVPAAGSQGSGEGAGDAAPSALLPDDRLTPALAAVGVESAAFTRAARDWRDALSGVAEAQRSAATNRALIAELETERATVRAELDERRLLLRGAVYDLEGLEIALAQLAVASYVRGGPPAQTARLFDVSVVTDELYEQTLARNVADDQLRRRTSVRDEIVRLQQELDDRTARLGELAGRAVEAAGLVETSTRRADDLTRRVPALEAALRDARMAAFVIDTDLPLVALDAYVRAAARLASEKPQCRMQWTMIAALGRIESRHGHINGATLQADGRPTVRIIGIGLTGDNGTALVPDSDDGRLDGDTALDRAVGPMQFIPTTWAIYRRDGNRDGVTDPQNIYDAALAAATYLCSSGRSLADPANLRSAYLAYNRSSAYVANAMANLELYGRLALPSAPRPAS
jgi:membrane-bound lytic murein transglycosylase B